MDHPFLLCVGRTVKAAHMQLTSSGGSSRRRMTIAQSLEHSWIKVRWWGCPHIGMAVGTSPQHGRGSPREWAQMLWA